MGVTIIVACDRRGVIGKNGTLPWRLKEDLQLFRQRTMGHAIIMGRKTWDSIPKKPLDGRANVVISKTLWKKTLLDDGFRLGVGPYYYNSIAEAIRDIEVVWKDDGDLGKYATEDIYVCGGAQIYGEVLKQDIASRIIMSKLDKDYDGDVYFPNLSKDWAVTMRERRTGFDVLFMTHQRKLLENTTGCC